MMRRRTRSQSRTGAWSACWPTLFTLALCASIPVGCRELDVDCDGPPACGVVEGHRSDCTFEPVIVDPAYRVCGGPTILFDLSNDNFHSVSVVGDDPPQTASYWAFARLLFEDGYQVVETTTPLPELLGVTDAPILVIANALPEMIFGQAFDPLEIEAITTWVAEGGSLLLIFDHPIEFDRVGELLDAFGLETRDESKNNAIFERAPGAASTGEIAVGSAIASGRYAAESLDDIWLGRGGSFTSWLEPGDTTLAEETTHDPVLVFGPAAEAPGRRSIEGHLAGLAVRYGDGRVYVSSEAGGFTAQTVPGGFVDHPQNQQLVLNVIHWLDGLLD